MKDSSSLHSRAREAGFTLMELLVTMAIVGILIATMAGVLSRSGKLYTTQNATAMLQQDLRAVMNILVEEVRMADYAPWNSIHSNLSKDMFELRKATTNELSFESDRDGNGKKSPGLNGNGDCEERTFKHAGSDSANNGRIMMKCGSVEETLLGGTDSSVVVQALDFTYWSEDDYGKLTKQLSPVPQKERERIRRVDITIAARMKAGNANPQLTGQKKGWVYRTYSTSVGIRNRMWSAYK